MAKIYTIFEGTSEIQRVIIGRALAAQAGTGPLHHQIPAARTEPGAEAAAGSARL